MNVNLEGTAQKPNLKTKYTSLPNNYCLKPGSKTMHPGRLEYPVIPIMYSNTRSIQEERVNRQIRHVK